MFLKLNLAQKAGFIALVIFISPIFNIKIKLIPIKLVSTVQNKDRVGLMSEVGSWNFVKEQKYAASNSAAA